MKLFLVEPCARAVADRSGIYPKKVGKFHAEYVPLLSPWPLVLSPLRYSPSILLWKKYWRTMITLTTASATAPTLFTHFIQPRCVPPGLLFHRWPPNGADTFSVYLTRLLDRCGEDSYVCCSLNIVNKRTCWLHRITWKWNGGSFEKSLQCSVQQMCCFKPVLWGWLAWH